MQTLLCLDKHNLIIHLSAGITAALSILSHLGQLYSFVSSVRLEVSVLWSGGLTLTWERAVARAGGETERLLEVAGYQVELFSGRGEAGAELNY